MLTSIKEWSMYDTGLRSMIRKILMSVAMLILVLLLIPVPEAYAAERTVEIGIPVEEHPELFLTRSMPTRGEGKIAVFLIEFPDYKNDNPDATVEYYDRLYFSGGIETHFGNTTVADFYHKESYGKLKLSGQVFDWYTARHERSHYVNREAELIAEAAAYYINQGVDFSQFDGDGDGVIDAITFHFAGKYSTTHGDPWYTGVCHSSHATDGFGTIDGLKFKTIVQVASNLVLTGEKNEIAVISHELMHTLGMFDLYGTRYFGLNPLKDLMSDNEGFINPYTKMLLGWVDCVTVVTSDTNDIRLDRYSQNSDQVILVTDQYNGIWDEFYLITYRDYIRWMETDQTVVWHVDARLNEAGDGFLNDNMIYDPVPNVDTGHNNGGEASPYLFIEEICPDPNYNYVLTGEVPPLYYLSADFVENSVIGPNSMISTDTHDGEYTGIRINDFHEYVIEDESGNQEKYVTFDVSFVEDTEAPTLVTQGDDLSFLDTVVLKFNESVYEGENWKDIRVLDAKGNIIDATISLQYYHKNQLEITFKTNDYREGYSIVLPQNCLKDSSDNAFAALTVTRDNPKEIYPIETNQLPSSQGFSRNNANASFFSVGDEILVITDCWAKINGENNPGAKIEFMRIDRNGQVLFQKIVDNPFAHDGFCEVSNVYQTAEGNYLIYGQVSDTAKFKLTAFCMDDEGNLLWEQELMHRGETDTILTVLCNAKDGLIVRRDTTVNWGEAYILIRSATGELEYLQGEMKNFFEMEGATQFHYDSVYQLSDGTYLSTRNLSSGYVLRFRDQQTLALLAELNLPYAEGVYRAYKNSDGTTIIVVKRNDTEDTMEILLLDAEYRLIKSVSQKQSSIGKIDNSVSWFDNDGFVYFSMITKGNHDNNTFQVRRYDRNLNILWETYMEASFAYFFMSPTGEIMAYRSMWSPKRECYIDYYGSEEQFRVPHTHTLVYMEAQEATCTQHGYTAYWYCTECGGSFFDQGNTPLAAVITAPIKGHVPERIPTEIGNCVTLGHYAGLKCGECDEVLQEPFPFTDYGPHEFTILLEGKEPTCDASGYFIYQCEHCDAIDAQEKPARTYHDFEEVEIIEANCGKMGYIVYCCRYCDESYVFDTEIVGEHSYGEWIVLQEPYCTTQGLRERYCEICGDREGERMSPVEGAHSYFSTWCVTQEATCTMPGIEKRDCRYCDASETREIPLTDNHSYGEWTVVNAATCNVMGEEMRTCRDCGKKETRELPLRKTHAYGDRTVSREPTCSVPGEQKQQCLDCGAERYDEIPVTSNHHYGEMNIIEKSTCITRGRALFICEDCGKEQYEELPLRGAHAYGEWSVESESTCVATGTEIRKCADCDAKETRQLGLRETHAYGEWSVESESTCVATGTEIRKCADCDAKETRQLALRETHAYGEWSVESESTCDVHGTEVRRCADCGDEEFRELALRETHAFGEWYIERQATCYNPGSEARNCTDCGTQEFRGLPMTDHTYGDWTVTRAPTSESSGEETRTCVHCGNEETRAVAALPEADNKSDGSDNSNNSGNNSAVIIVIAIVVGVAAGCGCTVVLLRKRK